MSYNMKELPRYIQKAGKITVVTALLGVVGFVVMFLINFGAQELKQVEAQDTATTTVTVLNTPPLWTIDAQESTESSTTTPTNSGSAVTWVATATDSNAESYYLLICSNGNAPTATTSPASPTCGSGAVRWAVSALTASAAEASAATTTTEAFVESNDWFAWVCDAVAINPRCNATFKQGTATTASPFNVNHRPAFTAFWDNSNTVTSVPGSTVTFTATSTDSDVVDDNDTVQLIVCSTNSFDTVTDTCDATTIATSTLSAANPTATYLIPIPRQDQDYNAFGFIIDNHGHESVGASQGSNSILTVANAAPTLVDSQIILNNGGPIVLYEEAGQSTGFALDFVVTDNNSCENASAEDEIERYIVSIYRSGIGSSTCDGSAGAYNANNCYGSQIATTTWNLSCTASSSPTDCTGSADPTQSWECTFPLWYIADPTDGGAPNTPYWNENWRAAVSSIDDDGATSTHTQNLTGQELNSFMMMALDTAYIAYAQLEPGDRTDPLVATTTVRATGNVGLDQLLTGQSMCITYTSAVTCANSSTSTIPDYSQVFATSSVSYGFASTTLGNILSSTTQNELEINVRKSTSTSEQSEGQTYWGIEIPASLTLAGAYRGENTFYGNVAEPADWE